MTEKEEKTPHSVEIEIDADGRVVLTDLPQDLIDLVHALDPDAKISCDLPTSAASAPANKAEKANEGSTSSDD